VRTTKRLVRAVMVAVVGESVAQSKMMQGDKPMEKQQ